MSSLSCDTGDVPSRTSIVRTTANVFGSSTRIRALPSLGKRAGIDATVGYRIGRGI